MHGWPENVTRADCVAAPLFPRNPPTRESDTWMEVSENDIQDFSMSATNVTEAV